MIEMKISAKVEELVNELSKLEPTEMSNFHQIRFIYPMGKIKEMALDQSFER